MASTVITVTVDRRTFVADHRRLGAAMSVDAPLDRSPASDLNRPAASGDFTAPGRRTEFT
jgi:hypothetical protein